MPELAEVEYYRKRWNPALGQKILEVKLHGEKRIFRQTDSAALASALKGQKLSSSETHGKQMMFRFTGDIWLGVHLGMSGELRFESAKYEPAKHDHLAIFTKAGAMVFEDARLFGLVLFAQSKSPPPWWSDLPPRINSEQFTKQYLIDSLQRSKSAPIKALLLDQSVFPGVGNWLADEILWQAELRPDRTFSNLSKTDVQKLWQTTREVCQQALNSIGEDMEAIPKGWLFDARWSNAGLCPKHKKPLTRETIGGRTSAFCPLCQK